MIVLPNRFSAAGKVRARIRLRRLARLRAIAFGRKSSCRIASSMRSRVAADTGRLPEIA